LFPPLFLSLVLVTGCSGDVEQEQEQEQDGPRMGENGCPAHLAEIPSAPCEQAVTCYYHTSFCDTDWSCDGNGKWISLLECRWPSDRNWCPEPVAVGGECLYIELSCPRIGPNPPCSQPIPTAVCGPDYVWEAAPDTPPTCSG